MPVLELVRSGELIATFNLDVPIVVVGRDEACDITLKGPLVSRKHCQFVGGGDKYAVQDLGSANGTYVNGERAEQHTLNDGDKVAVVPHTLVYRAQVEELHVGTAAVEGEAVEEYPATTKVSPSEILRRLENLFD